MKKIIILSLLCLLLSACSWTRWYQNASSGQIGCAPEDIAIYDAQGDGWGNYTWTAVCEGRRYYCSITQVGSHRNPVIYYRCTPAKQ